MMSVKKSRKIAIAAALLLSTLMGCAGPVKPRANAPDALLADLLDSWQEAKAKGGACASGGARHPYVDCGRIQAAIERLALEFPEHPPVLLVNAVLAFESGRPEKSIDYLDALLDLGRAPAEAVVLRSQIAIMQGNLPHAQRLLERRARSTPDHAGVREGIASVHYLRGDLKAARRSLMIAEKLGAEGWRVAYNRGLVDEADGKYDAALQSYRRASEARPEWPAPRARLRGLEVELGL